MVSHEATGSAAKDKEFNSGIELPTDDKPDQRLAAAPMLFGCAEEQFLGSSTTCVQVLRWLFCQFLQHLHHFLHDAFSRARFRVAMVSGPDLVSPQLVSGE